MIVSDLQEKWENLEAKVSDKNYKVLLLAENSHPYLYLARTPEAERALVLVVPSLEDLDFHDVDGTNISLAREVSNKFIVIKLLNIHYKELFDYLIISIFNAIRDFHDPDEYSEIFLRYFHKWLQFFRVQPDPQHNENVIQGIFGELVVLHAMLNEANGININSVLSAWRGPYNTAQDFIFDDKNIEVKTRKQGNFSVKIANENQLDQADGKDLELAVVRLDSQTAEGFTLRQLIEKILQVCELNYGDSFILFEALRQKNLAPGNFANYDQYIFHPADITLFDCGAIGFPKIVRSALETAINRVGYSINTGLIEDFEIRKIEYDNC